MRPWWSVSSARSSRHGLKTGEDPFPPIQYIFNNNDDRHDLLTSPVGCILPSINCGTNPPRRRPGCCCCKTVSAALILHHVRKDERLQVQLTFRKFGILYWLAFFALGLFWNRRSCTTSSEALSCRSRHSCGTACGAHLLLRPLTNL